MGIVFVSFIFLTWNPVFWTWFSQYLDHAALNEKFNLSNKQWWRRIYLLRSCTNLFCRPLLELLCFIWLMKITFPRLFAVSSSFLIRFSLIVYKDIVMVRSFENKTFLEDSTWMYSYRFTYVCKRLAVHLETVDLPYEQWLGLVEPILKGHGVQHLKLLAVGRLH